MKHFLLDQFDGGWVLGVEIWWYLGFKGGDSVVPKLVLVVVFNDGADSMVGFGGRVNRWMGLWWVTMMGLGEVVFSGELFGGLILGF